MSINFPNSPSNGQQITSSGKTYTYNSSKAAWKANLAGGFDSGQVVNILNQNAIDSAVVNSVVSNSSEILDSSQVVSLISTNSNKVYTVATMGALGALTGMATGDQALVTSTNKLFMYNSTGWYLIATITNGAPSAITGVDSAYTLAQDGTATVINAIATDPEGVPLSWSSSTSGLGNIATITQGTGDSSNYFTVTPSTSDSNVGTFTLTIAATDNVNGAVNFPASFTLSFVADWTTTAQQQKLTASDAGSNDTNGSAVDIKGDRAITSAAGEKAAYVWKRSATTTVGSLSNAVYVHKSPLTYQAGMSGDANANAPYGLALKPDGTKAYIADANSKLIYQYSLSTPYVVTDASMSYDSVSFNLQTSMSSSMTPASMFLKPDGTKMYVLNGAEDIVYEYDLSTAFDLSTISYNNKNLTITSVEKFPESIFFKPDGTKLYVAGTFNDSVRMMDLSTAWDVSTATYNSANTFSVSSQDAEPAHVIFNSSGTKMYLLGGYTNAIYSYTLSTAWDVTTASYDSQSYSIASGTDVSDTGARSIAISGDSDGNKLFSIGNSRDELYRIDLPLDYWSQEAKLDRSSDGGQLYGAVAMSTDNNYVILGSPAYGGSSKGAGIVYVRSGTSWTFQAALVPSDVAANDEAGLDVSISSDGTYATVGAQNENSGQGAAYVFIRSGTSWTQQQKITEPTRENTARFGAAAKLNDAGDVLMCSSPLSDEAVSNAGAAFIFTRSGTTWSYSTYVAGSDAGGSDYAGGTGSGINQQNASDINEDGDLIVLGAYGHNTGGVGNSGAAYIFKKGSTHYDIAGATFTAAEYVHANFTNCTAITFNGDGTKIFAAGGGYDRIASYTLTTAYDISTASYDSNPLVTSSYEGNPNGLQFNADGTKLFFCGSAANRIFVYNLTTGYDLSTASIGNSGNGVSFASQDTNTRDMKFKPDGTVLYVVGQQYDKVYQYSLSTAFDITTISYASKSFSVTSQESTPEGIDFTPDGTKMFIIGEQYNDVFQYNLSTAWDVSTASYANISYDLGSRQAQSSAVIFNPNGTKMFTAGRSADNINEFDTSAKSYSQVTKLTPPSNVLNQDFGETVAISGNTVAIGFQSAGGGGANAVSLVYDTSDESTWTLRKTFAGSDVAANYAYGFSIAIDETNKSIIVGSPGVVNQTPSPGAAYVFTAS